MMSIKLMPADSMSAAAEHGTSAHPSRQRYTIRLPQVRSRPKGGDVGGDVGSWPTLSKRYLQDPQSNVDSRLEADAQS